MGMDSGFHTAKSVHLKETLNQHTLCIEEKEKTEREREKKGWDLY